MAIINRVERLEQGMSADLFGDAPKNCGKGLKLPKGHPLLCCSEHNTTCWMRHNPMTWAKALIIAGACERRDFDGMNAVLLQKPD
jgi:hypothetical protein